MTPHSITPHFGAIYVIPQNTHQEILRQAVEVSGISQKDLAQWDKQATEKPVPDPGETRSALAERFAPAFYNVRNRIIRDSLERQGLLPDPAFDPTHSNHHHRRIGHDPKRQYGLLVPSVIGTQLAQPGSEVNGYALLTQVPRGSDKLLDYKKVKELTDKQKNRGQTIDITV